MSQEISATGPQLLDPPAGPPMMNHGRTVAGWFLFWVGSLGALVAGVAIAMASMTMVVTGGVLIAIGLIGSGVLRAMGHGQPRKKTGPPTVEDL